MFYLAHSVAYRVTSGIDVPTVTADEAGRVPHGRAARGLLRRRSSVATRADG